MTDAERIAQLEKRIKNLEAALAQVWYVASRGLHAPGRELREIMTRVAKRERY